MLKTVGSKCLIFLLLIAFIWSIISSYWALIDRLAVSPSTIFLNAFVIIFILLGIGFAVRALKNRTFLLVLIVLTFGIRLGWILNIDSLIRSDFYLLYQSALQAAQGNFQFTENSYFTTWVYQLGFTFYESAIIRLFGEEPFVLKLLNILYSTGTTVCVYFIGRKLFNEHSGRIAGLLYSLFIPNILLSSILTNQHFATFLFYVSFTLILYFFEKKYMWAVIGVLLSLGHMMRPLGPIILTAIVIYMILNEILGKDRTTKTIIVKRLAGVIATFYLVSSAISYSFVLSGVSKYPLENRDPLWKFVVGLNHESVGSYSSEDVENFYSLPLGEKRFTEERRIIKERLEDKSKLLLLFKGKFEFMWGEKDSSPYWSLGGLEKDELRSTLEVYERLIFVTTMIFAVIALAFLLVKKQTTYPYTLLILLILGYMFIHLLIEIQTRYRFFIMPSFILFQGFGISLLVNAILNRVRKT